MSRTIESLVLLYPDISGLKRNVVEQLHFLLTLSLTIIQIQARLPLKQFILIFFRTSGGLDLEKKRKIYSK